MKVIALRGYSNNGKSTTLNIVYQFLLLFGYIQIPTHFRVLNAEQKDFIDIIEKKGKKVGIVTMGDWARKGDSVKRSLNYLASQNCDVAICACNINNPGTVNAVMAYPNHHFVDKFITKIDPEQRIKNGEDAEQVYKLI